MSKGLEKTLKYIQSRLAAEYLTHGKSKYHLPGNLCQNHSGGGGHIETLNHSRHWNEESPQNELIGSETQRSMYFSVDPVSLFRAIEKSENF